MVIFMSIFPFRETPVTVIPSYARSMKKKALESLDLLEHIGLPPEWTGNPLRHNKLDYEQDHVRPLRSVFEHSDTDVIKDIIDKFLLFNKKLMNTGVIDKSFNIMDNFGLNTKGEIVLIDIGELIADPERIKKQICERVWSKHYVAGSIRNEIVQKYFIETMDTLVYLESEGGT